MRRAERALAQQCAARRQQAGHRVHRGDVERLIEGERREHAGQAAGEHRLAGPGRADEQEVVAAGGGDLERTARCDLPAHVGEVWRGRERHGRRIGGGARCRPPGAIAAQALHRLAQRVDGHDAHAANHGGLGRVRRRQHQIGDAETAQPGGDRQDAARR